MLAKRNAYPIIYFVDPLAFPICSYKDISDRLGSISADTIFVDFIEDRREDGCNAQTLKYADFFAYTFLTIF